MGERLSTEATTEQSVVSEQSSLLLTAAERRARFVTLHVQTETLRRWRGTGTSAVKHQSPCFDVRAHPGHWPFPILVCRHDRRKSQLCSWRCFWSSSAWSNSGKAVTAILPSHCLPWSKVCAGLVEHLWQLGGLFRQFQFYLCAFEALECTDYG